MSATARTRQRREPPPSTVRDALHVAADHAQKIDPTDSDLQELAYVVIHCTRALILALDRDAKP